MTLRIQFANYTSMKKILKFGSDLDQISFSKKNHRYPGNVTWETSVSFEAAYLIFNWENYINSKYLWIYDKY